MENLDTYLLMVELKKRLHNTLEAPDPQSDICLDELWAESTAMEETLKSLMYKLDAIINRYHRMMEQRYG